MNLTLSELITIKTTFEKRLDEELLKMNCFFQDHSWGGYSNESDPEFIVAEDFEAIEALTDKIKHMVLNIGCPNSVRPMIASICQRKIKRWLGNNPLMGSSEDKYKSVRGEDGKPSKLKRSFVGYHKGKQLRTNNDLARVRKSQTYYHDPSKVLVGHFRWNNRGYTLSRRATSLLSAYYSVGFSGFFLIRRFLAWHLHVLQYNN